MKSDDGNGVQYGRERRDSHKRIFIIKDQRWFSDKQCDRCI